VSACRVCGNETGKPSAEFCDDCGIAWRMSPERERFSAADSIASKHVAVTDFITRARAERQNGAKP
jgi:hypothetical protein